MICQYGAQYILKYIVGESGTNTSNTQSRFLGLSSIPVTMTGSYSEPAAASYARIQIGASGFQGQDAANFFTEVKTTTDSEGNITEFYIANNDEIHFREAQESWGKLTHFFIADSATKGQGNVYFAGELVSPITPTTNTIPIARTGAIKISVPTEYYTE